MRKSRSGSLAVNFLVPIKMSFARDPFPGCKKLQGTIPDTECCLVCLVLSGNEHRCLGGSHPLHPAPGNYILMNESFILVLSFHFEFYNLALVGEPVFI